MTYSQSWKSILKSIMHSKGEVIIAVTPQVPTSRPVAQWIMNCFHVEILFVIFKPKCCSLNIWPFKIWISNDYSLTTFTMFNLSIAPKSYVRDNYGKMKNCLEKKLVLSKFSTLEKFIRLLAKLILWQCFYDQTHKEILVVFLVLIEKNSCCLSSSASNKSN